MFAISGTKLDIGYEERLILKDFDMTVRKGEITTFVGPNGSGKSTLLMTLTRLISPQKGRITCCGKNLDEIPNSEFAQMVGVLPQHHIAPPGFVVKDLVSFGRVPYQAWHQTITEEDEKAICRAMEATGVWDLRDKPLVSCSGGEAQRVWIAMVLAQEPDLLFLDEPTTFLDISYQLEILRLVKELNRTLGMGVVMVLHDLSQAMNVSDRIVVLKDRKKYAEGPPQKVITEKMMKDVYEVDCRLVPIKGKACPVLVYEDLL